MEKEGKHQHHFLHKSCEEKHERIPEHAKHHMKLEVHVGLGAAAAGSFAPHEKHQAKDPKNGHKHRVGEEVAEAAAEGSAGFASHEHPEKEVAAAASEGSAGFAIHEHPEKEVTKQRNTEG